MIHSVCSKSATLKHYKMMFLNNTIDKNQIHKINVRSALETTINYYSFLYTTFSTTLVNGKKL